MKRFKLTLLMCLVFLLAVTAVACDGTETPDTTAATATTTSGVETTPIVTAATTSVPTETTLIVTTPATTAPTTTKAPTKFEELTIGDTPIADYTIVYAKSPYEAYMRLPSMKPYFPVYDFDRETAERLSDLIFEVTGVRLSVVQDTKTTAQQKEHEILVGETNRDIVSDVDISVMKTDKYVIDTVGSKLIICGGAHGTTWHALDYLEALFAEKLSQGETKFSFADDFLYEGEYHLVVIGCIGDSITQGVGASDQAMLGYPAQMGRILWKDAIVQNYGDSGSTMRNDLDAYTKTTPYFSAVKAADSVDIFTIMLGTNDSYQDPNWSDSDTELYKESCLGIMNALKEKNPEVTFVLANCPAYFGGGTIASPKIRQIQSELLSIANDTGYPTTFYDMYSATKTMSAYFPDTVHPNDMGHLKMAEKFAAYLQTLVVEAAEK